MSKQYANQQPAKRHLRFALFGNEYQVNKSVAVQTVLDILSRCHAEIFIDKTFYDFICRNGIGGVQPTGTSV